MNGKELSAKFWRIEEIFLSQKNWRGYHSLTGAANFWWLMQVAPSNIWKTIYCKKSSFSVLYNNLKNGKITFRGLDKIVLIFSFSIWAILDLFVNLIRFKKKFHFYIKLTLFYSFEFCTHGQAATCHLPNRTFDLSFSRLLRWPLAHPYFTKYSSIWPVLEKT